MPATHHAAVAGHVARLSENGDPSGLSQIMELPITAFRSHLGAAIIFQKIDQFPDFQLESLRAVQTYGITPEITSPQAGLVDRPVRTLAGNAPTGRITFVDWLGELLWHWRNGNSGFSEVVLVDAIVAILETHQSRALQDSALSLPDCSELLLKLETAEGRIAIERQYGSRGVL